MNNIYICQSLLQKGIVGLIRMKYVCKEEECGREFNEMPENNECPFCGNFVYKRTDFEKDARPKDPMVIGENGLGIIIMDFSGSMEDLAFPDEVEYTKSKANVVATALKTSIAKIKRINKADKAYIALIGFTANAQLIKIFKASEISEDKTEWDKLFTEGIIEFRAKNGEGTNITSALKLAREIYDSALRGDLSKYGINNFAPMYQNIAADGEIYNVANIRVFIYSDGEHCVDEFINYLEGASLIPGKSNVSGVTAVYLGHAEDIGYKTMEQIAGVCPRHNIKAVIHVDKSKNFDYLRDLFHMTSATSGFCPECAKENKKINLGAR